MPFLSFYFLFMYSIQYRSGFCQAKRLSIAGSLLIQGIIYSQKNWRYGRIGDLGKLLCDLKFSIRFQKIQEDVETVILSDCSTQSHELESTRRYLGKDFLSAGDHIAVTAGGAKYGLCHSSTFQISCNCLYCWT